MLWEKKKLYSSFVFYNMGGKNTSKSKGSAAKKTGVAGADEDSDNACFDCLSGSLGRQTHNQKTRKGGLD